MVGFGLLSKGWSLLKGAGKGTAIAAGVGTLAVAGAAASHEGGLVGLAKSVTGAGAEVTSHAGVEQTANNFFNFLKMIARILDAFGIAPGLSNALKQVGENGLENKTPGEMAADKTAELAMTDPLRTRTYDEGANGTRLSTYTVEGPNGSPPSVKLSTEPASVGNSVMLSVKGIKDGIGVALGWAGGIVAGAADVVGVDALVNGKGFFSSLGTDGWASATSDAIAGGVNNATDWITFNAAGAIGGGITGLFNEKGMLEGAKEGFNWEPTIRSETDASIYNVSSKVSAGAITAVFGGWAVGAAKLGATGMASKSFAEVVSHGYGAAWKGLSTAVSIVGVPQPGSKKFVGPMPKTP